VGRIGLLAAVPLLAGLAIGCTKYGATLGRIEDPIRPGGGHRAAGADGRERVDRLTAAWI
jgi:hypothetical protein